MTWLLVVQHACCDEIHMIAIVRMRGVGSVRPDAIRYACIICTRCFQYQMGIAHFLYSL